MVGIEQYIKTLFIGSSVLLSLLSVNKDASSDPDIFIDHVPEFDEGMVNHQPLILIKCDSAKDTLFYDDVFNAKDVTLTIGIGVNVYTELESITKVVNDILHNNNFTLIDSDTFNDTTENVVGSKLVYRNNIFMALN